jgi:hypothetical protein
MKPRCHASVPSVGQVMQQPREGDLLSDEHASVHVTRVWGEAFAGAAMPSRSDFWLGRRRSGFGSQAGSGAA